MFVPFRNPDWMLRAACRGTNDTMYPIRENTDARDVQEAKAICGGCPVRDRCLAFAIDNREAWGIWGGLTPEERRKFQRRPAVKVGEPASDRCGSPAGYHRHRRAGDNPCAQCRQAHNADRAERQKAARAARRKLAAAA